jgi:hypothetical protein
MASDFQPSMARAIKHSLECAAIKEVRLRRYKANLLAPLYLLCANFPFSVKKNAQSPKALCIFIK